MMNSPTMQELIEKHGFHKKRIRNGHQLLANDNTVVFEARGRFSKVLSQMWRFLRSVDKSHKVIENNKRSNAA